MIQTIKVTGQFKSDKNGQPKHFEVLLPISGIAALKKVTGNDFDVLIKKEYSEVIGSEILQAKATIKTKVEEL